MAIPELFTYLIDRCLRFLVELDLMTVASNEGGDSVVISCLTRNAFEPVWPKCHAIEGQRPKMNMEYPAPFLSMSYVTYT